MGSLVQANWANATILIESGANRGTGFLVARPLGQDRWRLLLVTNKHVIGKDAASRQSASSLRLYVNVQKSGVVVGEVIDCPIRDNSGAPVWREHPAHDVDVAAINVAGLINSRTDIVNKAVPEDWFGIAAKRQQFDITAGDEIMVIGYPSGIRQGKTNYPLMRQGMIASRIGEELHEDPQPGGSAGVRISRAFLIDGATIPGSSGSPVVLKPVPGRMQHGQLLLASPPPLLLGIVAETRFAHIPVAGGAVPSFAGLGFVLDVETVVEVMNLF